MASTSTDLATDANAAGTGTGLQSTDQSTQDPDTAHRIALLEHFIVFSITSGITSPGVLLEILHLADYDLNRATRIAELVKQSPPEGPSLIAQSGKHPANIPGTGTAADPTADSSQDRYWNSVGSVQANVGEHSCSAAAASQYSAAVVGCAPNSAGVGVGTSSGTTTSTAVPLSAVTSLPSNTNLRVSTCSGAEVGATSIPTNQLGSSDRNLNPNPNRHQNQMLQQQPSVPKNNPSVYGTPPGVYNGMRTGAPGSKIPKSTNGAPQQAATGPAIPSDTAHAKVASDMSSSTSYSLPTVSVLPPTSPSAPQMEMRTPSRAVGDNINGHIDSTSHTGPRPSSAHSTGAPLAPTSVDMGADPGLSPNGGLKLPPGVNPQMKLEDLFQYVKT